MSEYKGIKGFKFKPVHRIQVQLRHKLGIFSITQHQGQFKTVNSAGAATGTWSSGGDLNEATYANAAQAEHKLLEQNLEVMKDLVNLILHMKNIMVQLGQQAQP